MAAVKILLTHRDLTVEVETKPCRELIDHMQSTVLGQPGGFRYRHMDLEEKMNAPGENYFMYLRKGGKMVGSVGFVGRHTVTGGIAHDSWMIRYFSIKAPMRSVPAKRRGMANQKDEQRRSSVLGRFIQPVMSDPSRLRGENGSGRPAIIYALIEQKNLRSMNFSTQMGLETVREIKSYTYSRLRPKRSDRVEQLQESEQEHMTVLLKDFYSGYNLFYTDPLFGGEGYFVIREGGRIIAGLQAYPVSWSVIDFGSGIANLLVRLLVRLPWIKKRLNPGEMKLLAFDGLYYEQDFRERLFELMEGVLERTGRHVALMMVDADSDLNHIISRHNKLGIVHRILGPVPAEVRVRFIDFPEGTRREFFSKPAYIPTFDNS